MTQLIPDLQNLKNEYLDPISYLNLISAKPEEFNPKIASKILENSEKVVPLDYLTKIYKLSEEYAIKIPDIMCYKNEGFGEIRINPLYIAGLILKNTLEIENKELLEGEILEDVEEEILMIHSNYEASSKKIYKEIRKFYGQKSGLEIKLKKIVKGGSNLETIIANGFANLKKTDSQIFDTDDDNKHFAKLVPYIAEIVDQTEI